MQTKAIVTGHSRGLGFAIAANLVQRGIPTLGLSRRTSPELANMSPLGLLEEVALDLADAALLAGWLAGPTLSNWVLGSAQVLLINNAGVLSPVGPLHTQEAQAIAKAVALNVAAPLILASAVAAASTPTQDRRILHISSGAARHAYAGWSVYCATKAALDQHARSVELDQTPGLRICSLAPGVIDTDMQAQIRTTPENVFPMRDRFQALQREGRLSSPKQCAEHLVSYMLDDAFGQMAVADLRDLASQ